MYSRLTVKCVIIVAHTINHNWSHRQLYGFVYPYELPSLKSQRKVKKIKQSDDRQPLLDTCSSFYTCCMAIERTDAARTLKKVTQLSVTINHESCTPIMCTTFMGIRVGELYIIYIFDRGRRNLMVLHKGAPKGKGGLRGLTSPKIV